MSAAKPKIYAIVFPDGRSEICESTWKVVRIKIDGVTGVRQKGDFKNREDAETWIKATKIILTQEQKKKRIKAVGKAVPSKGEGKIQNINTPHWNKIRKSGKMTRDE